jgi:hypothetical protein
MDQQTPPTNPVPPQYDQQGQQQNQQQSGQSQDQNNYRLNFERPKMDGAHPMVVLQPGELIVANLKRHPFGIIQLYVAGLLGIGLMVGIGFFIAPNLLDQYNNGDGMTMVIGGVLLLIALMVLVLGVATSVYWQNEWVITTDSITQIIQTSLFNRQVSQLSMENLEDVTVNQDGIIPHMFGFGTLKVETAGERSKFIFLYCPNPNDYARKILEIHEAFLEDRRNVQNVRGSATITTNNPQPPLAP